MQHRTDLAQGGRRASSTHGRRGRSAAPSARGGGHLGAPILRVGIKKRDGLDIPKAVIRGVMAENGTVGEDPRKKKRRRRARYECTHSNSMWHTD